MNAEATNDPGHNEYLAAAAGMRETYGWRDTSNTPKTPTYAIGDFVSGVSAGKRWQGRIWEIDGDRLSIEIDGGWLAVSAKDVTH
jgi:hypothetical protein